MKRLLLLVVLVGCEAERETVVEEPRTRFRLASLEGADIIEPREFTPLEMPEPEPWQQEGPQTPPEWQAGPCECNFGCAAGQGPAAFTVTLGGATAGNGTFVVPCTGDCHWGWVNPSPVPCGVHSIEIVVNNTAIYVHVRHADTLPQTNGYLSSVGFMRAYNGPVPCSTLANEVLSRIPQTPIANAATGLRYPESGYCSTGVETCVISSL